MTRAADLENQRERLAKEAHRVATQMFASQSAPSGWAGLFDELTAEACRAGGCDVGDSPIRGPRRLSSSRVCIRAKG